MHPNALRVTIKILYIFRSTVGWQFKIMNLRNMVFCEGGNSTTSAFSCLVIWVPFLILESNKELNLSTR